MKNLPKSNGIMTRFIYAVSRRLRKFKTSLLAILGKSISDAFGYPLIFLTCILVAPISYSGGFAACETFFKIEGHEIDAIGHNVETVNEVQNDVQKRLFAYVNLITRTRQQIVHTHKEFDNVLNDVQATRETSRALRNCSNSCKYKLKSKVPKGVLRMTTERTVECSARACASLGE